MPSISSILSKSALSMAFVAVFLAAGIILSTNNAQAARKYSNCPDNIYSMLFVDLKQPLSGKMYIKLANKIPDSNVILYTQNDNDSEKCAVLGQAAANSQSWNYIADISQAEAVNQLYADGPEKSADIYQSTAQILKLTDPKTCQTIDTQCHTTYQGYSGVLKPQLLTGGTDSIAVYTVLPINDSKIKEVAYYSDGSFLYKDEKNQINPVNKNYLEDGAHRLVTQVTFQNGQVFNIEKDVDLGKDFTGFTNVRSYYYKSHNRYLYIIAGIAIFLVVSAAIWIARVIHQRREYKKDHGIDNLQVPEIKKEDEKDKIVVG